MLKTKDGYGKVIGTTVEGSPDKLLLSNGNVKDISDFSSSDHNHDADYLRRDGTNTYDDLNLIFSTSTINIASKTGDWWLKISTKDSSDKTIHRFTFEERLGSGDYVELFGVDGNGDLYAKNRKVSLVGHTHDQYVTGGPYLPLTGGTLTGDLTFSAANIELGTNWIDGYNGHGMVVMDSNYNTQIGSLHQNAKVTIRSNSFNAKTIYSDAHRINQSAWDNGLILNRTVANGGCSIKVLSKDNLLGNFGINGSKRFEVNLGSTLAFNMGEEIHSDCPCAIRTNLGNPYIMFTQGTGKWYVQVAHNIMGVGNGWDKSIKIDADGNISASGFKHSAINSDDYVLLAGGGYKALSELGGSGSSIHQNWEAVTHVGLWRVIATLSGYLSAIISVEYGLNGLGTSPSYLVNIGWDTARITLLTYNNFIPNSLIPVQLFKTGPRDILVAVKAPYGYNGASIIKVKCRGIRLSYGGSITPVTTETAVSSQATGLSVLTTSYDKAANFNADLLDGYHASSFLLKSGGTMTGNLTFSGAGIKLGTNWIDGYREHGILMMDENFNTQIGSVAENAKVTIRSGELNVNGLSKIQYTKTNSSYGDYVGLEINRHLSAEQAAAALVLSTQDKKGLMMLGGAYGGSISYYNGSTRNNIIYMAKDGCVGIGNNNPIYRLDIAGFTSISKGLILKDTTAGSAFNDHSILFGDSGAKGRIGANSGGYLGIYAPTGIAIRPNSTAASSTDGLSIFNDWATISYSNRLVLLCKSTDYPYITFAKDSTNIAYVGASSTGKAFLLGGENILYLTPAPTGTTATTFTFGGGLNAPYLDFKHNNTNWHIQCISNTMIFGKAEKSFKVDANGNLEATNNVTGGTGFISKYKKVADSVTSYRQCDFFTDQMTVTSGKYRHILGWGDTCTQGYVTSYSIGTYRYVANWGSMVFNVNNDETKKNLAQLEIRGKDNTLWFSGTGSFNADMYAKTYYAAMSSGIIFSTPYSGTYYKTMFNHGNGNISINSCGGSIYLGYWNTQNIYCRGNYVNIDSGNYTSYFSGVLYWAKYEIYITSGSGTTYTKIKGNHNFITGIRREDVGTAMLTVSIPSGYTKNDTMIFGNGHHTNNNWGNGNVYMSIQPNISNPGNTIRIILADDSSRNDNSYAYLYFLIIG